MDKFSNAAILTTILSVFGAQLLIAITVARWAVRWQRDSALEVMRAEMASDDSVFGKHRRDPLAHEPLRRQFMSDLHEDFEKLTAAMNQQNANHREEMKNLSMIIAPIVEQNGRAIEIMSEQMRRHTGTGTDHDEGNHRGVGRG